MTVKIISRAEWGALPWNGDGSPTPNTVPLSERTWFVVHHDGDAPITRTGNAIPQAIDRFHQKSNGWAGIGYNFVISQAGDIYEGRGWNYVGAHCPDHNRTGIGVQIAVGGNQEPSLAALRAACDLYELAVAKTGNNLAKKGHRDGFATSCPGTKLYAWIKAGMPRPGDPVPTAPSQPKYQPFPGAEWFKAMPNWPLVTAMGKRLVAEGCGAYTRGPGPQWTSVDRESYRRWQVKLGYTGADADGWPGKSSWDALKVPHQ